MDYHAEFVVDFAKRTRKNLEFVEAELHNGRDVFEVTQLANSMLGLLVFPREEYMSSIPNTPLTDLVADGWPAIKTTLGSLPSETLNELMRMLRNSIAHCNVEFIPDSESQIAGIKLWNTNRGVTTWQTELSIGDLRTIAFKFVEMIEGANPIA